MTAIFSTRRGEFTPIGPVFHIERTGKRKPALDPKDREAVRCLHQLTEVDSNKHVTFENNKHLQR